MSLDCSRFSFNAWHDFLGVVMQQGRVQLDSDWNEGVAQLIRRLQTGSLDTFERTVVPRTTPTGFQIEVTGGQLTIGVGRIYVDGILAENHGAGAHMWDRRLAEVLGSAAVPYDAQPYYPQPPELPTGGRHLIYLDVWQREVTPLQVPELVEKAVGVDTTGRWQTVWQVKLLRDAGNAQCSSADADIPGWIATIRPSGARLSTGTAQVAGTPDPCLVPPEGGYLGLENQLYRVEIHAGGDTAAQATFKWSRDNGSVATTVRTIDAARTRLTVDSIGRDSVRRLSDGDWVEITDDVRELHGEPGVIRRILPGGGVDDATRSLVLSEALPAGLFPTGAQDATDASRHTRIRRWDQSGPVLRADGSMYHDLDAPGASGAVPVPPAGTVLLLEDGIVVEFTLDTAGGGFRSGDHWSFAARSADASVELLDRAPPRGIHHHYARLAFVDFPDGETDCRVFWPPAATEGHDCSCDVCVTPEGHAQGSATLQQAIDRLAQTGGTICLAAGSYRLRSPLRIEGMGGITLRGKGWRTVLIPEVAGAAIIVERSVSVALEQFAVAGAVGTGDARGLIVARNTVELELDRLYLLALAPGQADSVALQLSGYSLGCRIRSCALLASIGVSGGQEKEEGLLTSALHVADTLFACGRHALVLGRQALLFAGSAMERNLVLSARGGGLAVLGATLPGGSLAITGNTVVVGGDAIMVGVDGVRINDNEIRGSGSGEGGAGVLAVPGLDPAGIGALWISGNRLAEIAGSAIEVRTTLQSAFIDRNRIEHALAAIVFVDGGAAGQLAITGNQISEIAATANPAEASVVAVQVIAAERVEVSGNRISGFAQQAVQARDRVAIRLLACAQASVRGNHFDEIAPVREFAGHAVAIELQPPYRRAEIVGNFIARSAQVDIDAARWQAIRVGVATERGSTTGYRAVMVEANQYLLLTASLLRRFALLPPEVLTVSGNQGSAQALSTGLVEIAGPDSCIFSGNHFDGSVGRNERPAVLVMIAANAIAVANNRLRWTDADLPALELVGTKAFTVLGNITMGGIRIGGADLPDPWRPLNLIA